MESARLATAQDLDAIDYVAQLSAQESSGTRGDTVFRRLEAAVPARLLATEALVDPQAVVIVGCYQEVVFGYLIAQVVELSDGELLGAIRHLVVQPEIRKSGIGEAMMDLAKTELKALGCTRIDAYALPGDRHTKNFFESFGLKARLLTVHAELD